jgi:putative transcriptional regulator
LGDQNITNNVRRLRTDRGVTQIELAAALQVSRQTVISLEQGRYLPSLPLAFRIAAYFQLPIESVFMVSEERP